MADSDEEDDSQGLGIVEDVNPASSPNLLEQHDKPTEPQDQSTSPSEVASPSTRGRALENNNSWSKGKAKISLETNVNEESLRAGDNHALDENTEPIGDAGGLQSSSDILKALIDEGEIDELQQDHYNPSPGTVSSPKPVFEPLSTAQPQIPSSPPPQSAVARATFSNPFTKFPSSSPTHLRPKTETNPRTVSQENGSAPRLENERSVSSPSVNVVVEVPSVTDPPQSLRPGRNLRHRNPIQLHPYAIESEQYRQVLKARGVKPLRIVQTQNESQANAGDESQMLDGTSE